MRELEIFDPNTLTDDQRKNLTLVLCDEGSINCRTFRGLQKTIKDLNSGVVLVMPDTQYQKGLRGWAKAQILASGADDIKAVMPVDFEGASLESRRNWARVIINGRVIWDKSNSISIPKEDVTEQLKVFDTTDKFDRAMMNRAKRNIDKSNCWLDPAGCVFVKGGEVLVESTSQSLNDSKCVEIPIDFRDLSLNPGERMIFCDSLHSERVGISQAARDGISLKSSTMYVTKFPCRPCAQSAIEAGVKTIVFEQGSYGLIETADLFRSNDISLKRIVPNLPSA